MYPVLPQTEADFSNWLKGFHLIQITHFSFAVIALWLGSIPENCSFFYEAGKISVFRLTPSTTLLKTFIFFVCICFCQFSFKGILILYTRKVVKNKNKKYNAIKAEIWMRNIPHTFMYLNSLCSVVVLIGVAMEEVQPCWRKYVYGGGL